MDEIGSLFFIASLEDDIIFAGSVKVILGEFCDKPSLVNHSKLGGYQIKLGQDVAGNDKSDSQFLIESLNHQSKFLDAKRI